MPYFQNVSKLIQAETHKFYVLLIRSNHTLRLFETIFITYIVVILELA